MQVTDSVSSVLDFKGHEIFCVDLGTSVYEALQIMADKRIGSLLVMDQGKLTGLISERDYARKVILMGRTSRESRVEDIMTSPVVCASPDDTVDECMRIMTVNRIRHLPIAHGGQVIGILSIGDLVNWVITAQAETIEHLNHYIAGAYPG